MTQITEKKDELVVLWKTKRYRVYSLLALFLSFVLIVFVRGISDDPEAIVFVAIALIFISAFTFILFRSKETVFHKNGSIVIKTGKNFEGPDIEKIEIKEIKAIELVADRGSAKVNIDDVFTLILSMGRNILLNKKHDVYKFDINLKRKNGRRIKIGAVNLPLSLFKTSGNYPHDVVKDPLISPILVFTGLPLEVSLVGGLFTAIPENITKQIRGFNLNMFNLNHYFDSEDRFVLENKNFKKGSIYFVAMICTYLLVIIVSGYFYITLMNKYHTLFDFQVFLLILLVFLLPLVAVITSFLMRLFRRTKIQIVIDKRQNVLEKIDMRGQKVLKSIPIEKICSVNVWRSIIASSNRYRVEKLTHIYTIETTDSGEVVLIYEKGTYNNYDRSVIEMAKYLGVPLRVKN